jgi:hypothetical protein
MFMVQIEFFGSFSRLSSHRTAFQAIFQQPVFNAKNLFFRVAARLSWRQPQNARNLTADNADNRRWDSKAGNHSRDSAKLREKSLTRIGAREPVFARMLRPGTPVFARMLRPGTPVFARMLRPGTPVFARMLRPGTPVFAQMLRPGTPVFARMLRPGTHESDRHKGQGLGKMRRAV